MVDKNLQKDQFFHPIPTPKYCHCKACRVLCSPQTMNSEHYFIINFIEFTKPTPLLSTIVIYKSTHPEITSPWSNHTSPSFLQHVSQQYCNYPGILSFTVEILLFNSVFYDRVTSVSVSTLKPPLGVIGVLPLKPLASPILSICI